MNHQNVLSIGCPIQRMVRGQVLKYIDHHKRIPNEMKHALVGSHHLSGLVDRLTAQIKGVQDIQMKRNRKKIGTNTLRKYINDFVELFLKGFEGHAERRRQSDLKKYETEHAQDNEKDMQSTLEGKSAGVFEDMGLVIPEDQIEKPGL